MVALQIEVLVFGTYIFVIIILFIYSNYTWLIIKINTSVCGTTFIFGVKCVCEKERIS